MKIIIDDKEYVEKNEMTSSGDSNSGDSNSGDSNSGDSNSGHCNSGDRNSGHCNSGHCNSGDCNSGDWNSGDWNSGDSNSGHCNSNEPKKRLFNKETDVKNIVFPNWFYFDLTEWINVNDMSDEEKEKFYWYKTTDGYLRTVDYKEAWRLSFEKSDVEDLKKTLKLPNFDYNIFEEISGINKKDFDRKLK